jgi:hypothetical protein
MWIEEGRPVLPQFCQRWLGQFPSLRDRCEWPHAVVLAVVMCDGGSSARWCPSKSLASDEGFFLFYCIFAYSALACLRMGMSGSASFQSVKKS